MLIITIIIYHTIIIIITCSYIPIGKYTNIKLTTPDDLQIAEQILKERNIMSNYTDNNDIGKVNNSTASESNENSNCKSNDDKDDNKSYACSSERYRANLSK
jgi:hypothetical protein